MLELTTLALLLLSCCSEALAAPTQAPMAIPAPRPPRTLHGRFLHITDMHPDPYFKAEMSEKSACHRRKPKKAPRSGYYGMAYSNCDSPMSLTNYTLDFLEKEWSTEIDFVIWTGDSARHDNDRKIPRTTSEIYMLNRVMARRMEEVFLKKGVPVIPSLGNNDVWPHNIMLPGPNSITSEFSSIWRSFVPFESYQVFQRGGYYSVEVIPGSLAVISLNTMYMYAANKAVGGCEYKEPEDPGNLQFDWLEVQLEIFRARGMQVWLSGHVPPSSKNFFGECYVRYVELSLRYQDTIVGHIYGHMNTDHFSFLEADELSIPDASGEKDIAIEKHSDLYKTLLKDFAALSSDPNSTSYDDYGVVNVSPSVVPNPYLPSFRIFTYNTTGTPYKPREHESDTDASTQPGARRRSVSSETACARPEYRESWKCQMTQPWHSDARSPSRSNGLWTPLGYAQFYMPKLNSTKANTQKHPPKFKLEYLTYPVSHLHPASAAEADAFQYPIPLRQLPGALRNATSAKSKYAPYGLADLTIASWVGLAQRLTGAGEKKLRRRFKRYMYMGAGAGRE